jgi:predicted DNA-binding mobile mystery protein A
MNSRAVLRRQLDARLRDLPREKPPKGGWIRAIRMALGMTMEQLGARLTMSAQGVAELENREANASITLAKLQSAADALECDLLIAFVPRVPLDDMVHRQAVLKATQENSRLVHTMTLENQERGVALSPNLTQSVERWISKRGSRLWD